MPRYTIIEVDNELTVAEMKPEATAEEAADRRGGRVVDPGPFETFDQAYQAVVALRSDEGGRQQ